MNHESYRVLKTIWSSTAHKTPSGEPLWNINFIPTEATVVALNDEEAILFARRMGIINPVLQKEIV